MISAMSVQPSTETASLSRMNNKLFEHAVYALSCARRVELSAVINTTVIREELSRSHWLALYS